MAVAMEVAVTVAVVVTLAVTVVVVVAAKVRNGYLIYCNIYASLIYQLTIDDVESWFVKIF